MAKVAVELARALSERASNGGPGCATPRIVARGNGWTVGDVICTSGPHDRRFEEQHASFAIAVVVAGTFQSRTAAGTALMTPGSIMLGNAGQFYQCGHEHGQGDRSVAFWYSREYLETLVSEVGRRGVGAGFTSPQLPPLKSMSRLVARAAAGITGSGAVSWEELAASLAERTWTTLQDSGHRPQPSSPKAEGRVSAAVRMIEGCPDGDLSLATLAREAGMSRFHFLRTFEALTGITPHQFVLRTRLREAASRLADDGSRVLDIALDCGFGDVSNFNHAFSAEFGINPREYRGRSSR